MIFAFAALFMHLAVPAAATNAAAKIASLPEAPLPSRAAAATDSLPANTTAGGAAAGEQRVPITVLRASALDTSGSQVFSTIRIPETNNKERQRIEVDTAPSRRKWLALSIAEHSAATFDAYSTRRALSRGAYEADPTMKPFAGSAGVYGAIQVCPLAVDYVAKRMQRSESPLLRHTWWVPQAVSTGVYIFAGAHDLHVANQMH